MRGSPAAIAMTKVVTVRCRELWPEARIIYELGVGQCRADIAVVDPAQLILFELKSKNDTLGRLARQMKAFRPAAHSTILVYDQKWNYQDLYNAWDKTPPDLTWKYPERHSRWGRGWKEPRNLREGLGPDPRRALNILWADELRMECKSLGIKVRSAAPKRVTIRALIDSLTGREQSELVSRRLRARPMAWGDDPVAGIDPPPAQVRR